MQWSAAALVRGRGILHEIVLERVVAMIQGQAKMIAPIVRRVFGPFPLSREAIEKMFRVPGSGDSIGRNFFDE